MVTVATRLTKGAQSLLWGFPGWGREEGGGKINRGCRAQSESGSQEETVWMEDERCQLASLGTPGTYKPTLVSGLLPGVRHLQYRGVDQISGLLFGLLGVFFVCVCFLGLHPSPLKFGAEQLRSYCLWENGGAKRNTTDTCRAPAKQIHVEIGLYKSLAQEQGL